uniref:TBC1 domain family member 23 n=1 Tax=Acrobeloides nanus TaxID=290746 RepID=A0A914CLG7_9BILA
MSQLEEDLEIISGKSTNSDDWVKEGSSEATSRDFSSPPVIVNDYKQKRGSASPEAQQRHDRWVNLLGVRNKPDPLMDWDQLYNLKNQSQLRKDCRVIVDKIDSDTVNVPQIESLITLYCKKRRLEYDLENGWLDIMEKLLYLPFDQSVLFNVFYAITTKYVPRTDQKSKVFDLFRLLMQYHDPELCTYMESLRIKPQQYVTSWFRTLLAKDTDLQLCWSIWDHYFEKGDPFLIFFIALVFVQYARDKILTIKNGQEAVELLKNAPSQMSVDDVGDLLDICYVDLNYTPVSIREDFHGMLFGSNLVDDFSDIPLNTLMCLPISVQELYKKAIDVTSPTTAAYTYFVIDTRSHKDFNAGSVPGSYNLSGKLLVDDPEKFQIAMKSLLQFKEESHPSDHICFIGSGLEEDDSYMMMVISRFLHQNIKHISYVDGGYKALHSMLKDTKNLEKLSNHFNPIECRECNAQDKAPASSGWSIMERMKQAMKNKTEVVRTKMHELIENSHAPPKEENIKHISSKDRYGKRYRNVQSVFSINDSPSSDDEFSFSDVEVPLSTEKLKWTDVIGKPEITDHFEGHEIMPNKTSVPCYIALSRTHMHVFHNAKDSPSFVHASTRRPLSSIMRVTSKKRIPEFLTFKFGYELPTGEAHINQVHCFVLPKAGDCAKAVKNAIIALKPSLLDD